MSEKPSIDVMPRNLVSLPTTQRAVTLPTPPQVVPPSFQTPQTRWGANRLARYYDALTAVTKAQTGYLDARTGLAHAFIGAARAAHEVAELPEICAADSQVRELNRKRDYIRARREVEEELYGYYATQNEVDKLRRPRIKKVVNNSAAINTLLKAKVDMEALGEDTSEIDHSLMALQRVEA